MLGLDWLQCRRVRPVLWDYASERLSEGPMEAVEQHLHGCAVCRREVESFRSAQSFLSACRAEEEPAPPSDWSALRQRLLTQSPARLPEPTGSRRHSHHTPAILRGTDLESVRAPWQMQLLTSMGGAFAAIGIVAVGYGLLMHHQSAPATPPGGVKPNYVKYPANSAATTDVAVIPQKSNTSDVQIIGHVVNILNNTHPDSAATPSVSAQIVQAGTSGIRERTFQQQGIAPPARVVSVMPRPTRRSKTKLTANRTVSDHADTRLVRNAKSDLHFHRYTPKPEDRLPTSDQTASRYALEQVRPVGNDSEDSNNYIVGTVQPVAHDDDHDY